MIGVDIVDGKPVKWLVENSWGDDKKKNKTGRAELVGSLLAKRAVEKGIKQVAFDRGGFKYQGRVKALAEAARKGGLKF